MRCATAARRSSSAWLRSSLNVVLNLTLVQVMGYRGLALGTAVAATLNAGLLLWILQTRLGGLEARRTVRTLLSILVASGVDGDRGMAHRMAARARVPRGANDRSGPSACSLPSASAY